MKKICTVILSLAILVGSCFSAFCLPVAAVQNVTSSEVVVNTVSSVTSANSYAEYLSSLGSVVPATDTVRAELNNSLDQTPISFKVAVPQSGLYTVGMSYKAVDDSTAAFEIGMKIDGKYPFDDAQKLTFRRMWRDNGSKRIDVSGNEIAAEQVQYDDYYFNTVLNTDSNDNENMVIYLTAGEHSIELTPYKGAMSIAYFEFGAATMAQKYHSPDIIDCYTGKPIILEGEDATVKSSCFLAGKSDTSSVKLTPNCYNRNKVNYIGGGNWKETGDTIVWTTPELTAGYYELAFSFRQNTLIGGKTYRCLTVDGKTPFEEASSIGFSYDDNWQQSVYSDKNENPYLIYFSKGTHEIALSVTSGEMTAIQEAMTDAVASLGELYMDINMITGETVDIYRDYELFTQIPDMEQRLENIRSMLSDSAQSLLEITGQTSGSNYSVINNMIQVIDQMLNNKFEAHRYKNYYYTNYCSVSAVLQDMSNMPLDIDKIALVASGESKPFEITGFFDQLEFSTLRFFSSFTRDYNSVSHTSGTNESITVWVNWGRDQAQVLSSLAQRSFTSESGINVNIQLNNASIVQATLSGSGPDCILQHSRSEPVNLAMRGVLYPLSDFADCDEVLKRFQKGAELPYYYKNALYALPDTQVFYMMFYRRDILDQLGLSVPETWDDFTEAAKILTRHNMNVWLQNNAATDVAQTNAGIGSNNLFPSILQQNNLPIYTEDGRSTNLMSADVMEQFGKYTDYYRKMKFPVKLDFYNRFRTGTCPIGLSSYTLYTTLKVAAPEIDGLWGMAPIPGTVQKDGTVSHVSSGGGTGCAILKMSKNPVAAWEFLKWWTDAGTQLAFSNEIESIIGPTGRVALSNIDALCALSWDDGMLEPLLKAWNQVVEVPEYPGSYYVSRSIYQSFWNVVNDNQNPKDMLMKYVKEADQEITRKWKQYENRK